MAKASHVVKFPSPLTPLPLSLTYTPPDEDPLSLTPQASHRHVLRLLLQLLYTRIGKQLCPVPLCVILFVTGHICVNVEPEAYKLLVHKGQR